SSYGTQSAPRSRQVAKNNPGNSPSYKLQPLVHHRALPLRHPTLLPKRRESVTHVSGTICHLCVGSLTPILNISMRLNGLSGSDSTCRGPICGPIEIQRSSSPRSKQ